MRPHRLFVSHLSPVSLVAPLSLLSSLGLVLTLSLVPAPSSGARAADAPIRTQSVAEAGPDFALQGEYVGYLERDGDREMFGVQVIAMGKGSFEARGYRGGLPGAGWDRSAKLRYSGKGDGKTASLAPAKDEAPRLILIARGGDIPEMECREVPAGLKGDGVGKVVGRLFRVIRKSPTLMEKPPKEAVVLFDGTSGGSFRTRSDKPVDATKDGCLRLGPGCGGLDTKQPFGSCRLHIEFRLPFEPENRGQDRGNSGCYLQSRVEVQVLDSFGLEGTMGECGGMYGVSDPDVNMCFPPLSWQTYDIEFTEAKYDSAGKRIANARMTVRHNGVLVHPDREIARKDGEVLPAAPEAFGPGKKPLHLQDHGHEILYRNIWLIPADK